MDRNNTQIKTLYKCIMANVLLEYSKHAANTTDQRSLPLNKNMNIFWREKKSQDNGPLAEKKQDRNRNRTRQKNKREESKVESK